MRRPSLGLAAVTLLSALLWGVEALGQSGIEIDCEGTLQSLALSHPNLKCTCPCSTCSPDCSSSGAAPWSGGHSSGAMSSEMFAAQMLGEMLGQILASAFAPPKQDPAALEAQRLAEEAARKAWEAQQQKLRDEWKAKQAQAAKDQQQAQAQAQQQGQDLLSQMQPVGSGVSPGASGQSLQIQTMGGTIEGFKWDTPGVAGVGFKPIGNGRFDTSGLKSWQRLLCATHFSQSALAVAQRDPEQARFFEEQATKVSAGEAVELPCTFPAMPSVPEPPKADPAMAQTLRAMETVQLKVKELQSVDTHLQKLRADKTEARTKVQQAQAARAEAEAAKAQAQPDNAALLAEILRRLNEAQCQLDDANKTLQALSGREQELLQQKEMIRLDLQQVQQQVQGTGAGAP